MNSPSLSSAKRCLLVLDLNGTLLYRRRSKSSVFIRPYLGAFLRYISHPTAALDVAVWSSARRVNVDLMVEKAWTGAGASRVRNGLTEEGLGGACFPDLVFAREDMMLTDRQFRRALRHGTFHPDHNVRTTKDLRQLWLRLAQLREERMRAQARQEKSQQHQHPPLNPAVRSSKILDHDIHGPRGTILLDDTAYKARLQQNNHLAIPTYDLAELRADAKALTTPVPGTIDPATAPRVDEALLAVVGILSEMCNGPVNEWIRTGRVWSGPSAQLDPHEMWAQRRVDTSKLELGSSGASTPSAASSNRSLAKRLKSRHIESAPAHEPDPPFLPNRRPAIYETVPQWFSSPPLMRAWVEHGRRTLDRMGISIEHECVQAWPGWRKGGPQVCRHPKGSTPVGSTAGVEEEGGKSMQLSERSNEGVE